MLRNSIATLLLAIGILCVVNQWNEVFLAVFLLSIFNLIYTDGDETEE